MKLRNRIMVVDDDASLLKSLEVLLEDAGYAPQKAFSGEEALEALGGRPGIRVVVSDLSMPGMDGIELCKAIRAKWPAIAVLIMTAHSTVKTAVEAMKLGAFQYLTKPVDPDELLLQIEKALDSVQAGEEHRSLIDRTGDPGRFDSLVGSSPAILALRETIDRVAAVDSTVFVCGETGVGKELVARMLHGNGPRASRPMIVVNCTAIPAELLESELFGHEKGAFTGAVGMRTGRIEEAEGGTLFLDEVGDMPLPLQPKLLRFLQDRIVRRVGGSRDIVVDVRIISATHRNLKQAVAEGAYRADLYHRLNTIPLEIPPLRERLQDLPELCPHLLSKIAKRLRRASPGITDDALRALRALTFPGNVRELENLLERALVLRAQNTPQSMPITAADLRLEAAAPPLPCVGIPLEQGMRALGETAREAERDLIVRALREWPDLSNHEIAERLGTNRRVLELRIKQHNLSKTVGRP